MLASPFERYQFVIADGKNMSAIGIDGMAGGVDIEKTKSDDTITIKIKPMSRQSLYAGIAKEIALQNAKLVMEKTKQSITNYFTEKQKPIDLPKH